MIPFLSPELLAILIDYFNSIYEEWLRELKTFLHPKSKTNHTRRNENRKDDACYRDDVKSHEDTQNS